MTACSQVFETLGLWSYVWSLDLPFLLDSYVDPGAQSTWPNDEVCKPREVTESCIFHLTSDYIDLFFKKGRNHVRCSVPLFSPFQTNHGRLSCVVKKSNVAWIYVQEDIFFPTCVGTMTIMSLVTTCLRVKIWHRNCICLAFGPPGAKKYMNSPPLAALLLPHYKAFCLFLSKNSSEMKSMFLRFENKSHDRLCVGLRSFKSREPRSDEQISTLFNPPFWIIFIENECARLDVFALFLFPNYCE